LDMIECGVFVKDLGPQKGAETMLQQMGMDYWLGKAQEVLARH
jgi:hypothetical protein